MDIMERLLPIKGCTECIYRTFYLGEGNICRHPKLKDKKITDLFINVEGFRSDCPLELQSHITAMQELCDAAVKHKRLSMNPELFSAIVKYQESKNG